MKTLRIARVFTMLGMAGVSACSSNDDAGAGAALFDAADSNASNAGSAGAPATATGDTNQTTATTTDTGALATGTSGATSAETSAGDAASGASGAASTSTTGDANAVADTASAGGASGTEISSGGSTAAGGNSTTGGTATTGNSATAGGGAALDSDLPVFSFFVTSLRALQDLSGSTEGFGGDLRYGEADGLSGADKICGEIAERSMPGSSAKQWRAFLSTVAGPVHAKDRIGEGPWYDRLGRTIALTKEDLLNSRPVGADPEIIEDLPNEDGVPNHAPDGELVDNHDTLTGTNDQGTLYTELDDPTESTCKDWTSAEEWGAPRVGHPWPTGAGGPGGGDFGGGDFGAGNSGGGGPRGGDFGGGGIGDLSNWMSALNEAGCAPGVWLTEAGPPGANGSLTVGDGGGYGAFYCFALTP